MTILKATPSQLEGQNHGEILNAFLQFGPTKDLSPSTFLLVLCPCV